jgi:hypothetical protein
MYGWFFSYFVKRRSKCSWLSKTVVPRHYHKAYYFLENKSKGRKFCLSRVMNDDCWNYKAEQNGMRIAQMCGCCEVVQERICARSRKQKKLSHPLFVPVTGWPHRIINTFWLTITDSQVVEHDDSFRHNVWSPSIEGFTGSGTYSFCFPPLNIYCSPLLDPTN